MVRTVRIQRYYMAPYHMVHRRSILDRSLDRARWSPVRNRYVFDKNSVFDENNKFFKFFFQNTSGESPYLLHRPI